MILRLRLWLLAILTRKLDNYQDVLSDKEKQHLTKVKQMVKEKKL